MSHIALLSGAAAMLNTELEPRVAAVRRFNRFYTQRIGVLQEGWLKSQFSLAEARVLYELTHRNRPTASELAKDLGLDAGYLSRILRGFEARGLIVKQTSDSDGRQSLLSITERGRERFAPLETRTNDDVQALLGSLPRRRADAPDRIDAHDRRRARRKARAGAALCVAPAARRRHGLDREPPRRALRPGLRLGRADRSPDGGDRRDLRAQLRRKARALLDRRTGRRERRLGHAGERDRRGRAAAPPAGRAEGARVTASAPAWSRNASASRARPATARSRCGPTACSPPPGASTSRPASRWSPAGRTTSSARSSPARTGI